MKQEKLALSAVMIVAVGLIGTNFVTGLEMTEPEKLGALSSNNDIYGHLTIVHSDPDGNILNYIQTDNIVGLSGKSCISELIFGQHSTTCEIGSGVNTNFTTIGLFSGEEFTDLINATQNLGLLEREITVAGLTIRNGGQGVTVSQSSVPVTLGDGSKTDIAKTFTAGIGVSGQVVDGAGLFNNGTGVGGGEPPTAVLAAQTFNSVTMNESDTLLITWTIELG